MVHRKMNNPEAQFEEALRLLKRGKYQPALRQLKKLLPLTADNPALAEQVHLVMADISLSLRQLSQTIRHAETVIELNAENYRAYYLLGFAYSVQADWEQSISALQQALRMAPADESAEYHRALGWSMFNRNPESGEGLKHLEKALQTAPMHTPILTDLAMAYAQKQDFDKALVYARQVVQIDPADAQAREMVDTLTHFRSEYKRLGGKRAKRKKRPSTEAEWRKLIAETDNPNELVQLWLDIYPAKDINDANESIAKLMALWNSTPRPELGGRSPDEMFNP